MLFAEINVSNSVERGIDVFFAWLPAMLGALAILVIGYFVAKLVGNLIGRALGRAGLDRSLGSGQMGQWTNKVTSSPSRLIGRLAFWALFIGVISLAVSVLGINALTAFVGAIFAYLPNVIAAFLIFLVAAAISAGIAALAQRLMGDTPTGRIVSAAGPILVMTIATFMILDQLKIAEDIVRITYAALLGAIALGSALAFGLGGRDVAARMLEGAYQKGQEQKEQVRQDVQQGKDRAKREMRDKKDEMEPDLPPRQTHEPAPTGATATTRIEP